MWTVAQDLLIQTLDTYHLNLRKFSSSYPAVSLFLSHGVEGQRWYRIGMIDRRPQRNSKILGYFERANALTIKICPLFSKCFQISCSPKIQVNSWSGPCCKHLNIFDCVLRKGWRVHTNHTSKCITPSALFGAFQKSQLELCVNRQQRIRLIVFASLPLVTCIWILIC